MTHAALSPDACDVCAGRADLYDTWATTCSAHFLESLDAPGSVQRSTEHRQYGAERG